MFDEKGDLLRKRPNKVEPIDILSGIIKSNNFKRKKFSSPPVVKQEVVLTKVDQEKSLEVKQKLKSIQERQSSNKEKEDIVKKQSS